MCVVAERSVIQLQICSIIARRSALGANALKQRSARARGSADQELSVKPGREASGGEIGSENVDMSSDKQGERPCRRKSKGSCLKLI